MEADFGSWLRKERSTLDRPPGRPSVLHRSLQPRCPKGQVLGEKNPTEARWATVAPCPTSTLSEGPSLAVAGIVFSGYRAESVWNTPDEAETSGAPKH